MCSLTTPLYVREGVVSEGMFYLENGVMFGLLALSFVALWMFVAKYKTSIETDDVREEESRECVEFVATEGDVVCLLAETCSHWKQECIEAEECCVVW